MAETFKDCFYGLDILPCMIVCYTVVFIKGACCALIICLSHKAVWKYCYENAFNNYLECIDKKLGFDSITITILINSSFIGYTL